MNNQETEAKFFVQNLQSIELRLLELKAQLIQPRVHEINYRFDFPNGELRNNKKVLRLRQDEQAKITFKGASQEVEGVMSREEIEFVVADFDKAKKLLESIGFAPVVFYEKFRRTYELNETHIMLDELPYGEFVEIESNNINEIKNMSKLLGLSWDLIIKAGYHALFDRVAEKYNLEKWNLSFEALNGVKIKAQDLQIEFAD
ncbi:MAG: putative adenylate cyclase [Chloroflexi bacterium OLB14]|nr:MAG: putative adenylate cyclase [Chloroflexi bacterium OLB14]